MRGLQNLLDVQDSHVRHPMETPYAALLLRVRHQEVVIVADCGRCGQFHPVLHPAALRGELRVPGRRQRLVAPASASRPQLLAERRGKWQKDVLGFQEHPKGQVVNPRLEAPGLEHADNAIGVVFERDDMPDRVARGIQAGRKTGPEHHDIGVLLVIGTQPGCAACERRHEHGEEVGCHGARRRTELLALTRSRLDIEIQTGTSVTAAKQVSPAAMPPHPGRRSGLGTARWAPGPCPSCLSAR